MPLRSRFVLAVCAPFALVSCGDDGAGPPPTEEAGVRINEFLASNSGGLVDEDGDTSDWLELHNTSSRSIDVTGWFLTDDAGDPTRWPLPSAQIPAGGFLLVFASNKDRDVGELHTNFNLSAGGEYLGLLRPDGSVADEFSPTYPSQTENLSYGHVPGGGVGFLRAPTPGRPNTAEASVGLNLSPDAGLFTGTSTVTLSFLGSETPVIRYTTDGTEPTTSSTRYEAPFEIDRSIRLRARAFVGAVGGPEVTAFYTAIDQEVADFQSHLPVVVIHTFGQAVPNDDDGVESAMTVVEPSGGTTTVSDPPSYAGGTTLDLRGYTSAMFFAKAQYKLELHDVAGSDVDADLLGMGLEEDWILYGPGNQDRHLIGNPLMQRLAGAVGLPAVSQKFVEVFLDESGTGPVRASDYVGIYTLGENIKIDVNRLDMATLGEGDDEEPEITGGYILKLDRVDDDEHDFETAMGFPDWPESTIVVARPKIEDLTNAQISWIESHFDEIEASLFGPQYTDPANGYRAYIDVDSWIDGHILGVLSKDPDLLVLSHYLAKDREELLAAGPLWDFDRALNSVDPRSEDPEEMFYPGRVDPFEWSWWGRLFSDPAFEAQYRARWTELRAGPLSQSAIFGEIEALAERVAPAYGREDARWGSNERYGSRYGTYQGEIDALKAWLTARLAFLDGEIGG